MTHDMSERGCPSAHSCLPPNHPVLPTQPSLLPWSHRNSAFHEHGPLARHAWDRGTQRSIYEWHRLAPLAASGLRPSPAPEAQNCAGPFGPMPERLGGKGAGCNRVVLPGCTCNHTPRATLMRHLLLRGRACGPWRLGRSCGSELDSLAFSRTLWAAQGVACRSSLAIMPQSAGCEESGNEV